MIRNAENPRNSFITTTQLAKICQADPKSVRTWVERKQGPPHVLTPGRHLRFRVGDVAWRLKCFTTSAANRGRRQTWHL